MSDEYGRPDTSGFFEASEPFPYHELDGETDPATTEEVATNALTQMLQWFLGFLFYHKPSQPAKPVSVAFKRLLALAYISRPDLIEGKTLDDLTAEIGESRNALSRWIQELTYMFGQKGLNQQALQQKIEHHFQALARFDAQRHTRPVTIEEWIIAHPPTRGPQQVLTESD